MDFTNLKATAELANLIANGLMLSETSSYYFHLQTVAKWLSCNGEPAGVGPTAVVASAAAVYLYHELRASVRLGAEGRVAVLETLLLSTMVLGALALMVHVWVCATRFFLYYLDTLVRESPCILLELTTAGLMGARSEAMLGPLTKFVRDQQHQIHITVCWFLALCYADYVRKHYCETFNFPYLEQWQTRLQQRTSRTVRSTAEHVGSFVTCVQQRLQALARQPCDGQTVWRTSFARLVCPRAAPLCRQQPARAPGNPAPASYRTSAPTTKTSPPSSKATESLAPASDTIRLRAKTAAPGNRPRPRDRATPPSDKPSPAGAASAQESSGDCTRATRGTSPTPSTSLDIMSRIRDVLALGVRCATQAQFRPSEVSQLIAEQDLDIEFLDVL